MNLDKCELHKIKSISYGKDHFKQAWNIMAFYVGNHKNNPTKYSECGCHKQVFVSFTELQKDPIAAFQKILEIFIPGTVCQNRIDLSA